MDERRTTFSSNGSAPSEISQREIHILREAWFAPSLHGNSADEAGTPTSVIAETLQLQSGLENIDHRRSFANHACISTMPEEGRGGMVRTAWLKADSIEASACRLSASRVSRRGVASRFGPASFDWE